MVLGFEKRCVLHSLRKVKHVEGHFKTCNLQSAHSKINKLTSTSHMVVTTVGCQAGDLCSVHQRGLFVTLLLSGNLCLKLIGGVKFNYANCLC